MTGNTCSAISSIATHATRDKSFRSGMGQNGRVREWRRMRCSTSYRFAVGNVLPVAAYAPRTILKIEDVIRQAGEFCGNAASGVGGEAPRRRNASNNLVTVTLVTPKMHDAQWQRIAVLRICDGGLAGVHGSTCLAAHTREVRLRRIARLRRRRSLCAFTFRYCATRSR